MRVAKKKVNHAECAMHSTARARALKARTLTLNLLFGVNEKLLTQHISGPVNQV